MLFLLLAAAVIANDYLVERQFYDFKKKHNKNYTDYDEHLRRFEIFKMNLKKIEAHNAKKLPYKFGVTQFADMTQYEFGQYVKRGNGGGYVPVAEEVRAKNVKILGPATCTSVDWVDQNKVTPVKNQGQCGSCWSFSTTGAIEGRVAISTGQLASLSEQELVDCDTVDQGCNGGLMDNGFTWVINNGGLCTEVSYPYTSGRTEKKGTCEKTDCSSSYGKISSFQDVETETQEQLEAALCQGPVAIAIEADQSSFQHYISGVLTGTCGKNLDHGVLLVGMGTENGQDYWKVKNSWGSTWGEDGYIKLCRNCKKNCGWLSGKCAGQCGLMKQPSYPVV